MKSMNIGGVTFYVIHVVLYSFGIFGVVDYVGGFLGYRAIQVPFLFLIAVMLGLWSILLIGSGRLNLEFKKKIK